MSMGWPEGQHYEFPVTADLKVSTTKMLRGLTAGIVGPTFRPANDVGPTFRSAKKKSQEQERFRSPLLALSHYYEGCYACSPLGATDVRPQSSHVR